MANNRMYLLDRQSGKAVYLGKKMGGEWYRTTDVNAALDVFFADVFHGDVCIAMEDTTEATMAVDSNEVKERIKDTP